MRGIKLSLGVGKLRTSSGTNPQELDMMSFGIHAWCDASLDRRSCSCYSKMCITKWKSQVAYHLERVIEAGRGICCTCITPEMGPSYVLEGGGLGPNVSHAPPPPVPCACPGHTVMIVYIYFTPLPHPDKIDWGSIQDSQCRAG